MRSPLALAQSGRSRGLLAISGGSAAGQVIAVGAVPLLSRIYSPADFGVYTVVAAVTLTFAAVAPLRFDLAVPLPTSRRDAYSLVTLGLWSTLMTALLGTVGVALLGERAARQFRQPELLPWLWAAPWTAGIIGIYMVFSQLAVRDRKYVAIGRRNALQSAVLVIAQLAAGLAGWRPGGLVVGLCLGQVAGTMSLLRGSDFAGSDAREGRRRQELQLALRRYWRFPVILAPSGLINVVGMQLPILFIASFYGGEVAGWLGLTQRVLALPLTLVGAAAAQVYLGEFTTTVRENPSRAPAVFVAASKRLALVGVALALVLWMTGPQLFGFVFGTEWNVSGRYAQALALGFAFQLMAAPLSQTLIAFERQLLQVLWDAGRLFLVAGATLGAAITGQPALTAIWVFSVASAAAYLASWLLSRHAVFSAGRPHQHA